MSCSPGASRSPPPGTPRSGHQHKLIASTPWRVSGLLLVAVQAAATHGAVACVIDRSDSSIDRSEPQQLDPGCDPLRGRGSRSRFQHKGWPQSFGELIANTSQYRQWLAFLQSVLNWSLWSSSPEAAVMLLQSQVCVVCGSGQDLTHGEGFAPSEGWAWMRLTAAMCS